MGLNGDNSIMQVPFAATVTASQLDP